MIDAILGTVINDSGQKAKGCHASSADNGDLFSQILNLISNSGEEVNIPQEKGSFLWAQNTVQLLKNRSSLQEEPFVKETIGQDSNEIVPSLVLMDQLFRQSYPDEETIGETHNPKIFVDYQEKMQKIDLTKQQRNLSQVVDNIEAEMAEQTIEKPVEQMSAMRDLPKDNPPLVISNLEGDVEQSARTSPNLEVTEESTNKAQGDVVIKENGLEEVTKLPQGQTNNSSDLSKNNETQHSQQLDLVKLEPKANLDQISQDNKSAARDELVTPKELPKHILQQLKNNFKTNMANNTSEVTIRLKPESLGKILLHLTSEGEKLSIKIFTESNLTKVLVEQNMSLLRQSLEEQGIRSKSINVEVGGDNLSQQFNQQRGHQARGDTAYFINKKNGYTNLKVEEEQNPLLQNVSRRASGLSKIEFLA